MTAPIARAMVVLPDGVPHGTPAGFAGGCRDPQTCPALYEHGMCCQYAHVRAMTDNRYHAAKHRNPTPAAIARALGISPVRRDPSASPEPPSASPEPPKPAPVPVKPASPAKRPKKARGRVPAPVVHGTRRGYQRGCRDDCPGDPATGLTCRKAATAVSAEFKRRNPNPTRVRNDAIRAWARGHGIELKPGGPIPAYVRAAHSRGIPPVRPAARAPMHGTPHGYNHGCRDHCPGHPDTGLTCREAAISSTTESKKRRDPHTALNAAIREWAQLHGIPVSPRGKIPDLVRAAHAAGDPTLASPAPRASVTASRVGDPAAAAPDPLTDVPDSLTDVHPAGTAAPAPAGTRTAAPPYTPEEIDRVVDFARAALDTDLYDWQEAHLRAALAARGGRVLDSRRAWRRFLTSIPTIDQEHAP